MDRSGGWAYKRIPFEKFQGVSGFGFLKDCLIGNVTKALIQRGGFAEVVSRNHGAEKMQRAPPSICLQAETTCNSWQTNCTRIIGIPLHDPQPHHWKSPRRRRCWPDLSMRTSLRCERAGKAAGAEKLPRPGPPRQSVEGVAHSHERAIPENCGIAFHRPPPESRRQPLAQLYGPLP